MLILMSVFGRPFVKRFALCYQSVVCLSCLSVTLVHCGQMVWRIKMKLGMQVGLGPGHILLDETHLPSPKWAQHPQFSAHICCGQMAAWIKMPLGMELGIGPGDFVLDGDPANPNFRPMFIIVIVISLLSVQVQVLVLCVFYFYKKKFNHTQSIPIGL